MGRNNFSELQTSRRGLLAAGGRLAALGAGAALLGDPLLAACGSSGKSSSDTLSKIKASKTITVGIANETPYGFTKSDGTVTGVEPEIMAAALRSVGITHVKAVVTGFDSLIPGLMAKRFDAITAGLYINPQRCSQIIFGNPDLVIADGVIVKAGNPLNIHSYKDIAKSKAKMVTGSGSAVVQTATNSGVSKGQIVLTTDPQSEFAALKSGRAQMLVESNITCTQLVAQHPGSGFEIVTDFEGAVGSDGKRLLNYTAPAFRRADDDLAAAFDRGLAAIRASGEYQSIMKKFAMSAGETPDPSVTAKVACSLGS